MSAKDTLLRLRASAKSTTLPSKVRFPLYNSFVRTHETLEQKHKSGRQASLQALPLPLEIVDATSSMSLHPAGCEGQEDKQVTGTLYR